MRPTNWRFHRLGRFRRFRGFWSPRAVILLYHRVARPERDPQLLSVAPEQFEGQMSLLRSRFNPLSLDRLSRMIRGGGAIPPRSVVVTFDDGYADNLHHAAPVLERHGVPATFFVESGHLGSTREFWWDELERLIFQARPQRVSMRIEQMPYEWDLDDTPVTRTPRTPLRSEEEAVATCRSGRDRAYFDLHRHLKQLSPERRDEVLRLLADTLGETLEGRLSHRAMTAGQLHRLAGSGLFEVGAHTVSHPQLSSLSVEQQKNEIEGSRHALEQALGRPVQSFSYPFGGRNDFTGDTVSLVSEAGFTTACANLPGTVGLRSDTFALPRCLVRDWLAAEFGRRLEDMFDAPVQETARCAA